MIPPLTTAQRATLKTHITGNSDTNTLYVAGNLAGLAALLNVAASPVFWAWRLSVSKDEYFCQTSVDGTTFNFTGVGYITRAQGERDGLDMLFNSAGFTNPSLANVRQAFADIMSGATAPAPANRTHMLTVSRRTITRVEKVFATGTGSTATPGFLVTEGPIDVTELIGL